MGKGKQEIEWDEPDSITFGEAIGPKQLSAKLVKGGGKLTYSPAAGFKPPAGEVTLTVKAAATNNFLAAEKSVTLVVEQVKQVIKWANPAAIAYGEELGPKQLNATLTKGNGKLEYDPKAGTVLKAGKHPLTVTAGKTANFEPAEESVTLVIEKARQVIKWDAPDPITFGTPLSAKELDAKLVEGDGRLTYTPPLGAKGPAGPVTLKVTAAETANYEEATAQVILTVKKQTQEFDCKVPARLLKGTPCVLKLERIRGDGPVSGTIPLPPDLGKIPKAGKCTFTLILGETKNYEACSKTFAVMIEEPPVSADDWFKQLGFKVANNTYILELGDFPGCGPGQATLKGKKHHLTVFKSSVLEMIEFGSAREVCDSLFPKAMAKGFHITVDCNTGAARLKNPHVYRGLDELYVGQGTGLTPEEQGSVKKKLTNMLEAHLTGLLGAIKATGWTSG